MRRSGFTLLEMILALAIGLVLMISLYSVLNMQVQSAQSGRARLEEGTIARDILKRMSVNILSNLGASNPTPTPASSAAAAGSSSSTTTSSYYPSTSSDVFVFNGGVYGNSGLLVLSACKVPKLDGGPDDQQSVCDLRRISYWMTDQGLAVQQVDQATGEGMNSFPPDVPNDSYKILAPEVKDILFEFFDGSTWQSSWDGTTLGGPNADTPVGPPAAIRITLTFYRKAADGSDLPDEQVKYPHVVCIPAGNNFSGTSQ